MHNYSNRGTKIKELVLNLDCITVMALGRRTLSVTGTDVVIKLARQQLVSNLTAARQTRFSDTTHSGVIHATQIATISNWPSVTEGQQLEGT